MPFKRFAKIKTVLNNLRQYLQLPEGSTTDPRAEQGGGAGVAAGLAVCTPQPKPNEYNSYKWIGAMLVSA